MLGRCNDSVGTRLQSVVLLASQLLVLHDVGIRPNARVRRLVAHGKRIISRRGERPRKPPLAVIVFPVRNALRPAKGNILHVQSTINAGSWNVRLKTQAVSASIEGKPN